MKKLATIFVLVGIILGSFFAQEATDFSLYPQTTIHASSSHSGNQSFHQKLIFSEISNETEDSERSFTEMNFMYIYEVDSEIRHIKNILSSLFIHSNHNQQEINFLPIFLVVRSILI